MSCRLFFQIFCSLACMAKATVQAALGPVILRRLNNDGESHTPEEKEQKRFAEIIQLVCILSIVVTAPM